MPADPRPEVPQGVSALHWTDEWRPTAPLHLEQAEAAMWILAECDWAAIIEEQGPFYEGMDPLVYYGLREELYRTNWLEVSRFPSRLRSELTAWVASKLVEMSWCANEDHHDDMIPFNDCFHGEDPEVGDFCRWEDLWVLDGDPHEFFRLAIELIRDGWEPTPKVTVADDSRASDHDWSWTEPFERMLEALDDRLGVVDLDMSLSWDGGLPEHHFVTLQFIATGEMADRIATGIEVRSHAE